jgi:hypothetical protein
MSLSLPLLTCGTNASCQALCRISQIAPEICIQLLWIKTRSTVAEERNNRPVQRRFLAVEP